MSAICTYIYMLYMYFDLFINTVHVYLSEGHNWGSSHDPPTSECSPSQDNGGKFLMYPIAQDGSSVNNNVRVLD